MLDEYCEWFRRAFWELNQGRVVAVGMNGPLIQALALTDIFAMADTLGIDRLHFLRVIRPSDALYRELVTARQTNGHR